MAWKRGWWFKQLDKEHHRPPWKVRFSAPWRWKRPKIRFTFLDDLAFRFLYFLEAFLLVSGLCCFFLCCGCHI